MDEDNTIAELLGLEQGDIDRAKQFSQDMPPSVQVPLTPDKAFVTFVDNNLKVIEKEQEVETQQVIGGQVVKRKEKVLKKMPLIRVRDDSGVTLTLWLTSRSLKQEFMRLWLRCNKDVTGVRIAVWREKYQHKQYGETVAYRIAMVDAKK